MATHVSAGEPGQYREARWMENASAAWAAPARRAPTRRGSIARARECTPTSTALALAASLVEHGKIDANAAARNGDVDFGRTHRPTPAAADGGKGDAEGVGRRANRGAVLVDALSVCGRLVCQRRRHAHRDVAFATELRPKRGDDFAAAVEKAILSSHRHPEAVDFAVVQAAAVQHMLRLARPPSSTCRRSSLI